MSESPTPFREAMARPGPDAVIVNGIQVKPGSRVRLEPRPGGDIIDVALVGRTGIVQGVDQDEQGLEYVTVALEDDPGRDLGLHRAPAHRFFFRVDEIVPLHPPKRILVAGIGNMFLGDDGFGCEVARRFALFQQPLGITVEDFGVRGMDLAYEMVGYEVVVMIDAVPQGGEPGTLYVMDADVESGPAGDDTRGMDPVKVIALARTVGPLPDRVIVVGCEPAHVPDPNSTEVAAELSAPMRTAIEPALQLLESLIAELARPVQNSGREEQQEEEQPERLNQRSTG